METVLSAYFQPSEREEIRTAQLAWWCDTLQDWTVEQVVYGLRRWNEDNPRRRPTPGDVLGLLKRVRGQRLSAQVGRDTPEPERKRVTAADAAEIMRQAGFAPRKMEDAGE